VGGAHPYIVNPTGEEILSADDQDDEKPGQSITSGSSKTPMILSNDRKSAKRHQAHRAAVTILSAYPNIEMSEPYILAVTELLEDYSEHDIARLMNRRTGITGQCKFAPTIAEIVDFIEGPAIHKHSDGKLHRTPEWVVPSSGHGRNFTGASEEPDPRPKP
jgi:hypothetical protein